MRWIAFQRLPLWFTEEISSAFSEWRSYSATGLVALLASVAYWGFYSSQDAIGFIASLGLLLVGHAGIGAFVDHMLYNSAKARTLGTSGGYFPDFATWLNIAAMRSLKLAMAIGFVYLFLFERLLVIYQTLYLGDLDEARIGLTSSLLLCLVAYWFATLPLMFVIPLIAERRMDLLDAIRHSARCFAGDPLGLAFSRLLWMALYALTVFFALLLLRFSSGRISPLMLVLSFIAIVIGLVTRPMMAGVEMRMFADYFGWGPRFGMTDTRDELLDEIRRDREMLSR